LLILLKIIIYPLSLLPLSVIRGLLFPLKLVLKYLLPYRKKVIEQNLAIAYPNSTDAFKKEIRMTFYNNFYWLITESIKSFTMPEKEAAQRMRVLNPEKIDAYAKNNQSVIMVFGHFNNWEWTPLSCASQIQHQITAIYQPIKNKAINDWILTNRSRTGVLMMSTKETQTFYEKNTQCIANTFIADQSPAKKGSGVWVDFFGRKTLFLVGAATYAKKMKHPIVFINIQRVKAGYYTIEIEDLVTAPENESIESMVQKFACRLEKQIKESPGSWLWSHKRWKHQMEASEI
jgi:KDO2-lipid IV(A) lauroyltransferase